MLWTAKIFPVNISIMVFRKMFCKKYHNHSFLPFYTFIYAVKNIYISFVTPFRRCCVPLYNTFLCNIPRRTEIILRNYPGNNNRQHNRSEASQHSSETRLFARPKTHETHQFRITSEWHGHEHVIQIPLSTLFVHCLNRYFIPLPPCILTIFIINLLSQSRGPSAKRR